MICNILNIIFLSLSIFLIAIMEIGRYKYAFGILGITLIGTITLFINKGKLEHKHKVLTTMISFCIILFIISTSLCSYELNKFDVYFANGEKNLLKNIINSSSGNEYRPIKAKKNEKWGFIDNNGNVIIDLKLKQKN